MAKPHWRVIKHDPDTGTPVDRGHGCQHSECDQPAVHGWQRAATEAEIDADNNTVGPYGAVYRNPNGPHHTAVFACADHAPPLDVMALRHAHNCPAPDPGCVCE